MSRFGARRGVALVVAVVAFSVLGAVSDSVGAEASTVGFDDVPANTFYSVPVSSLAARGVFNGTECAPRGFCPDALLDRKTMAVWIVRMIDNTDPAPLAATRFTTDVPAGSFHAPFIERMAELKITYGCDPNDRTRFCPDRFVTRGQMAAFLTRAYDLPIASNPAAFTDVVASAWYAQDVANLAATGITKGCGDGTRFCPNNNVTRGEMATFLYRADSGLQEVIDAPPDEEEKATEKYALTALYNATSGANWLSSTNWLSDRPLNEWHGIWTDSDGRVTHVDLQGNGLSGVIPPELGNLANLQFLWLSGNGLVGAIPSELGRLSNLQSLGLYNTRLTGSIPPELGGLSYLGRLFLGDNQLSGAIPSELGRLSHLELLELEHNRLSGAIPSELGRLSNLTQLRLNGNQLSGAIPSELGSLTNLELLGLENNRLGGAIPSELGSLTNLKWLVLHDNRLTGMLPSSLTRLAGLDEFGFGGNSGLCAPTDSVFQDWLESIPNNWLGIPHGPNCADTADLSDRDALVAFYNATSGANWTDSSNWLSNRPLNEWHGVWTDSDGRVIRLDLQGNGLSGVIPPELGNLANLRDLWLSGSGLVGAIPSELGRLSNLQSLGLYDTRLSGSIPPELGGLSYLGRLFLGDNQLSGAIPSELGRLSHLELLELENNRLSGAIPSELGRLSNLTQLRLNGNQLSGAIPSELGSLTNLELLDLRGNPNLSGALPGSLAGLTSLSQLYVFGTGLCAPTDSAFQSWLAGVENKDGIVNCTEPMVEPLGGPPSSLGLDLFYAKYLDAGGLPIVSSSAVPDEALYRARDIIGEMLSDRADLIATMAERDVRVVVQGESMHATELPEVEDTPNWRGFFHDPLVVTSEENLLCYDTDPHRYGEVLIHELAHAVHFVGIEKRRDRTFSRRVEQAFQKARAAGLWDYTYAATNSVEYWAEGVEIWFGINDVPGLSGNDVNTRRELKEYDPTLANLVTEVFGEATVSSSCQEKHPSDRRTTLVQGVLTGPDGQPVDDVWIGARSAGQVDIRWGFTGWFGLMGTFWMRVHDGTYTLAVYAAPEGTCAGWYDGDGGVTTAHDQAARLTVEGTAVEDLNIRLPVSPEDLPSVPC